MKKYILLVIVLGMMFSQSVFAGADTDRICSNTGSTSRFQEYITLSYPGKIAYTYEVFKFTPSEIKAKNFGNHQIGSAKLYYMVHFQDTGTSSGNIDELYMYDCATKKPRLISQFQREAEWHWYNIHHVNNDVILVTSDYAEADVSTEVIYGINRLTGTKLFILSNLNLPNMIQLNGFTSSRNYWFIHTDGGLSEEESIIIVNKKTRKITQL